ncbi:putative conserved oligomeric Golgi complex subunit 2 [Sesbania bispinosa]|nr:putative conserved oligomeric Golgi complex subunit 2 [Sesbania bispinosa]
MGSCSWGVTPLKSSSERVLGGKCGCSNSPSEMVITSCIADLEYLFLAALVSPPPINPPAIVVTVPRISSLGSTPPSLGRDSCARPRPRPPCLENSCLFLPTTYLFKYPSLINLSI